MAPPQTNTAVSPDFTDQQYEPVFSNQKKGSFT